MIKSVEYRIEKGTLFYEVIAQLEVKSLKIDKVIGKYLRKKNAEKKIAKMLALHRILKNE